MKFAHLLAFGSACLLAATTVQAQWQWIDQSNKKVFSDTAPPPEIPDKNILRRPGPSSSARVTFSPAPAPEAGSAQPASAAPASAGGAAKAKPTGVDKDLEEKARKAEEAEKAKQAAEAQKVAQAKAENCQRARQGKATMDSGIRVARLNAQGEREVMDDKARTAETQRLQSVIDSDCK
ncbi:DUF4124 domain-containing protein [Variovorax sp. JS1663]|uniref:DUF4124 domain-containing protein n=1 Tax=Variovorax sp. JS1663 TaxID=1851577 RepID=UPI000B34A0F1|nr:DUF4124 domain-containing protein [Variovorax sp. JS1663]OUM01936.1 hypothetical protein A8M77_13905 [Variovorax sp. JS1663]